MLGAALAASSVTIVHGVLYVRGVGATTPRFVCTATCAPNCTSFGGLPARGRLLWLTFLMSVRILASPSRRLLPGVLIAMAVLGALRPGSATASNTAAIGSSARGAVVVALGFAWLMGLRNAWRSGGVPSRSARARSAAPSDAGFFGMRSC